MLESMSPEITRWVDSKGALSYIRSNAMVGRVRHWLPKQISGLDKIYAKTGLSFGIPNSRSSWNMHGDDGICFVVDRARLPNLVCNINGQSVFEFSGTYDVRYSEDRDTVEHYRQRAIKDSLEEPDEAFVVGDIRDLGSKLIKIILRKNVPQPVVKKITDYAEAHHVPVEVV